MSMGNLGKAIVPVVEMRHNCVSPILYLTPLGVWEVSCLNMVGSLVLIESMKACQLVHFII